MGIDVGNGDEILLGIDVVLGINEDNKDGMDEGGLLFSTGGNGLGINDGIDDGDKVGIDEGDELGLDVGSGLGIDEGDELGAENGS